MRLLHTADWHLGQTLHGVGRGYEHARFLDWLLDQIDRHAVDALVVAGDVFDAASPSADAQAQYFGFLADARRRFPRLDLVVVGGNHDAPARLDAARPVLSALRVHVVGGLPRRPDGGFDLDRLLVPLTDSAGDARALLLAVPYLRPRDLPRSRSEAFRLADLPAPTEPDDAAGPDIEVRIADGHRYLYEALAAAAEGARPDGAALVATGHAYVAGGSVSELSERKIQQGNQQALPATAFPPSLSYVALGHLHLAQRIGDHPEIRYSGSPLPLSMAELDYPHQVLLVDFDGPRLAEVRPAHVPRFVDLLRVPRDHAPLEAVVSALSALPRSGPPGATELDRPLLEARVRLEHAEPRLRDTIEAALSGAWARLVRIDVARPSGTREASPGRRELAQLAPEEVFKAAHRRVRDEEPSLALLAAFAELLETVAREEAPPDRSASTDGALSTST